MKSAVRHVAFIRALERVGWEEGRRGRGNTPGSFTGWKVETSKREQHVLRKRNKKKRTGREKNVWMTEHSSGSAK